MKQLSKPKLTSMAERVRSTLAPATAITLFAFFTAGCASYRPPVVFRPTPTATVSEFFSKGQPIAIVQGEDCAMMLAADTTKIAGQKYLRVWWLYANQAAAPVLIEPLQHVSVVSRNRESGYTTWAVPEAPSRILHRINNEKQAKLIARSVLLSRIPR